MTLPACALELKFQTPGNTRTTVHDRAISTGAQVRSYKLS